MPHTLMELIFSDENFYETIFNANDLSLIKFWWDFQYIVDVSYESSLAFNTRYTAKEKHDFMAPFR